MDEVGHFAFRRVENRYIYEADGDETDDSAVDEGHHGKDRGVAFEPRPDSLEMEVTQNEIYLHSLRLLRIALYINTLNERLEFKAAIVSMVIYRECYRLDDLDRFDHSITSN